MKTKCCILPLLAACLAFTACNYDSPLTAKATRKIDERLLGEWVTVDKDNGKEERMTVRKLDDSAFVVACDQDIYRAFHSDFEGVAFISIQDLNSDHRLYCYMTYEVSADGKALTLRAVNDKVVSDENKGLAALQQAVRKNLKNPALLGEPCTYTRKK